MKIGIDKALFLRDIIKPFHPNYRAFFIKDKCLGWVTGAFMFLRKLGFNICFTPSFEVVHLKQASSKFDIKQPLIKEMEGILYFLKNTTLINYF